MSHLVSFNLFSFAANIINIYFNPPLRKMKNKRFENIDKEIVLNRNFIICSKVTKDGIIEYVNDYFLHITGYNTAEVIGKIISAGFSLLMGYLVLKKNYEFGFMIFGIMLLVVTLLGIFILKEKKRAA